MNIKPIKQSIDSEANKAIKLIINRAKRACPKDRGLYETDVKRHESPSEAFMGIEIGSDH